MSEASAEDATIEDQPPRIQAIWVLPIIVLAIGVYVVVQTYLDQGPTITIRMQTAVGLEAGKTQVKALNVDIGIVDEVELATDLSHVVVTAKLNPGTGRLLREDTQIWVERPRVGASGVSGLGTLLSGAYVELSPGTGAPGRRSFDGLERAPATAPGVPGVRITLLSERANSVSVGDPVLYRGFQVGKIESVSLNLETSEIRYSAFVDAPYDTLVTDGARFWNASGVRLEADASGIRLQTGSLTSLLSGGVAFDVPPLTSSGDPVADGATFQLYGDQRSSETNPYVFGKLYVAMFERSLRGLSAGAPVEYRGVRVGTVERILSDELATFDGGAAAIPVLMRAEPGRIGLGDTQTAVDRLETTLHKSVANGLRATIQTGNLVSGSLYVSLDHYADEEPDSLGEYNGYPTIPTKSSGLRRLEQQVETLLAKLNDLPLDDTVAELNRTVADARELLASVDKLVNSDAMQSMPAQINATLAELEGAAASFADGSELYSGASESLAELNATLQSVRSLADTLEEQPNAVIFPQRKRIDPIPGADR